MSSVARDHAGDAAAPAALFEPERPAGSVAADMAAIFAPLPRMLPDAPSVQVPALPPSRPRSRRWFWAFILLVVAIVGGLLAGLTIPRLPPRTRVAVPERVVPQVVARSVPAANPAAAADPMAVTPKPAPAEPDVATPPKRTTSSTHRPVAPAAAPTRPARQSEASRDDCHDEAASLAWCLRGASLAADDRLRDAYAEAGRAHVDRATLVAIRKDWSLLRRRALDDPDGMIRGYADLTDELQRLTREARSR